VAPLLTIAPLPWDLPKGWPQALLFTSARSPQLAASAYPVLRSIPAYAVGARTADVAAEAGFRVVAAGERDGNAALELAKRDGIHTLWHLAGKATAPLHVPAGMTLSHRAVYDAARVDALPPPALDALVAEKVFAVLLFSARTARHFARLLDRAGLERSGVRLVVLSPAVAQAAGQPWRDVAVAAEPSLAGALAAAQSLWQGLLDG